MTPETGGTVCTETVGKVSTEMRGSVCTEIVDLDANSWKHNSPCASTPQPPALHRSHGIPPAAAMSLLDVAGDV